MKLLSNGVLSHCYYGKKIPVEDISFYNFLGFRSFGPKTVIDGKEASVESLLHECSTFGRGVYRTPTVEVIGKEGTQVNDLFYSSHRIISGKPKLTDMPSLDAEVDGVQTLEVVLRDIRNEYEVTVFYSVFEQENIISRRHTVKNISEYDLRIEKAFSATLHFEHRDFDVITLPGSWARERQLERFALPHGKFVIDSCRGASSHQYNPFVALTSKNTDEHNGDAYGFSLIYSGNFQISAEADHFDVLQLQIGINPDTFSWNLKSGESFDTPEAIMTYSADGLNGMSQNLHNVCRNHLGKCANKQLKHPIVINCWEAMYFSLDEEKFLDFIESCSGMGIDTVVMDDGWFGQRYEDNSSLGDWFINREKFPNGFDRIIEACHKNGMKFGLWFEPEMICRKSRLYEMHPDWCIHNSSFEPLESRNQLTLDFSRREVIDNIYEQMHKILESNDISYIKWDMNRHIADAGSLSLDKASQGEFYHRYILGVYQLISRLTQSHPDIFFEGCSGGGGRFDFGILYYMPQIWTSDNSDAIDRLKIQYGTSLVYPCSSMTAHVSACPNHQTGRTTPFMTRGDVAQVCSFGYELNVKFLSDDEKQEIRAQISKHRELEALINQGDFYRLRSPFEGNNCSWQIVSADKSKSYVMFAFAVSHANPKPLHLKLCGLSENALYRVEQLDITVSGATLMNAGIPIYPPLQDYATLTFDINIV
ncbi:MAG: alpha-galactosidase [Clostridia bacterium]|nr:alpha-galactosidase [Clostridia bacterium]